MQKIKDYLTLNGWKTDFRQTVSDLQKVVTYINDFARSQYQKYSQNEESVQSLIDELGESIERRGRALDSLEQEVDTLSRILGIKPLVDKPTSAKIGDITGILVPSSVPNSRNHRYSFVVFNPNRYAFEELLSYENGPDPIPFHPGMIRGYQPQIILLE